MNFGSTTSVRADPQLEAERVAAKNEKVEAIRSRVSSLTDQLVRTYGARQALLGGSTRPPILGF